MKSFYLSYVTLHITLHRVALFDGVLLARKRSFQTGNDWIIIQTLNQGGWSRYGKTKNAMFWRVFDVFTSICCIIETYCTSHFSATTFRRCINSLSSFCRLARYPTENVEAMTYLIV